MDLSTENLLNYLKNVCELEHSLFEQECLFDKINNRIYQLKNWQPISMWDYEKYDSREVEIILSIGLIFAYIFFSCIGWFGFAFIEWLLSGLKGNTPIANVLFWISIVILVIIKIIDIARIINKKTLIKKKNENIKQKNQDIESSNNKQITKNFEQAALLENQLEIIANNYNETKEVLDRFYDLNIIYKKYRNMPAVFAFYEFIESGRCNKLKGHKGAYNIYEDLLLKNIIIDKLDLIIANLNAIKNSQYLLYEAIEKSNNTSEMLSDRMKSLADSVQNIEKDEKINLYYNKINSKNLKLIKDLHFYDNF